MDRLYLVTVQLELLLYLAYAQNSQLRATVTGRDAAWAAADTDRVRELLKDGNREEVPVRAPYHHTGAENGRKKTVKYRALQIIERN